MRLEVTVSALETRVADLEKTPERTSIPLLIATLPASTSEAVSPEPTPPIQAVHQAAPYIGPVKISAMAFTPGGDALYLARTTDVQRNQDGVEQALYTWSEAVPNLLADFSTDRTALAARLNNGDVVVLGLPQGVSIRTFKLGVDFAKYPTSLSLSPDSAALAVASGENTVLVWQVGAGESLITLTQPGAGVNYQTLLFSPDSAALLGGFRNTITQWDLASGAATTMEPGCRGDAIFDLAYSPDGKQVAIACGPIDNPVGFLILWDMVNNRSIFQREEIQQVHHVAFSPDGKWLATGGPDGNILFWDVTGNREPVTVQGQATPVYDMVFSPDGSQLVYATEGGLVYLNLDEIALP
jgi:WD40 repeat protein